MRVPTEASFTSRLRSPAIAARVGVWLGICFAVCFVTGLVSHWAQLPRPAVPFPTSPAWGYRVTQGLHVFTGVACVPLLLVKLWSVQPRLLRPLGPSRRVLLELAERGSIAVLVGSAVFQLATGLANAARWYPWQSFSFRTAHYAIAWVAIGALVLHVAVKLPVIRSALGADVESAALDRPTATRAGALSRRGLLGVTAGAAALALLSTAGSAVPWLRRVSVFGVRSGDGPGGVPVNTSAERAGVRTVAADPAYRLEVVHGDATVRLGLDELAALPQRRETLPIACVEGWSASGTWGGVRLRDVLALVDAPAGTAVVLTSLQESGPFRRTRLPGNFVDDDRTLLALELAGEPLDLDHGYPVRLIAPNRPGVLQTKWLARIEVVDD
ncbi:molybdopterin-dependent oxidoreductase [Nocardioides zeae]|uniref:Molybdopterin-dependent oxidoreductase n=1 Tax=Nocardioides imazamoxiresistens TaxID=3231893 RepID=A0ABU3PR97_9ACTN|nr:molybdopterin-dependent oxidoreductase [Nocardioides zeae]MDT9591753.1 molybdopterin-dependent oxidoreductase [Nocardioides zeae]